MKLALLYTDVFERGGYPRDVRWLAGALSRAGIDVTIFGQPGFPGGTDGLHEAISIRSWQSLPLYSKQFDLIHIFGLFSMLHPLLAIACELRGVPLIISPFAQLLPLHMAVNRRKKELFISTAWIPWVGGNTTFHVFSQLEADSVRKWLPNSRVFEGTLGIFPAANLSVEPHESPNRECLRNLLFFGRNDVRQKGLDVLLEGYANALKMLGSRANSSVKLTIAGQPWNGSATFLADSLRRLGIEHGVNIVGEVDDLTKTCLLTQADYLIFLSRWDGPPRPIREAVAMGTPVVVTPESNMGELVEQFGAGLQVGLSAEEVAQGLLCTVLDGSLLERCRKGVEQLKAHLAWDRVAKDYIKGYVEAVCLR
jgi:glycosyltransferase involved in cell wall biosynthesis